MSQERKAILNALIAEPDVKVRIGSLVEEIAADFGGDELTVIGLLKGSFMFMADLVRALYQHDIRLVIDFMLTSSYGPRTKSSGTVTMTRDIAVDIKGRPVLLVDDILDTGRTLAFATDHLLGKAPESLKTCVFLDKPDRRAVPFQADYVGFVIPDKFVVGYGLDFDSRYRELPYLSTLSFEDE